MQKQGNAGPATERKMASGAPLTAVRRYACLIPHFSRACVLLLSKDGKWELPAGAAEGPALRNPTPKLRKVLDSCGLGDIPVSLLRFARLSAELTIWQCQNDDESWRPPAHGRWANREELKQLELGDRTVRAEMEAWFDEFDSPPPARAPWECQGWWQGPMEWIRSQLPAGACPVVGQSCQQQRNR